MASDLERVVKARWLRRELEAAERAFDRWPTLKRLDYVPAKGAADGEAD